MRFRWTRKDLEENTDAYILRGLVAERKSTLNPYGPLAERLQEIYNRLDGQVRAERTN